MIRAMMAVGAAFGAGGCTENPSEAQANAAEPIAPGAQVLVFEFPDGSRGGTGRIQGQGQPSGDYSNEMVLAQLRECGAIEPRFVELHLHAAHVVSRATSRDREIVACFKRTTFDDFNVSLAAFHPDPREFRERDTGAFREFEDRLK